MTSEALGPRAELHCPVSDCKWTHEMVTPDMRLVTFAPGAPSQLDFKPALVAAAEADDNACRRHLAEHPVEDFLRTINELRHQVSTLTDAADVHRDVVP